VTEAKQRDRAPFPSNQATGTTDADLVARCRAGDMEAFETIYRQHSARIYSLAARMAGSRDDGEDLLQEIFVQAHRKLDSFKGDSALGTWLYRLALNYCLDFVRSKRAKMAKLTDSLDGDRGTGGGTGLGTGSVTSRANLSPAMAVRETPVVRLDLERALEQLPEGCREAFVLHDVEGFDHKEVAGLLEIAEGTSKSQVFKARARLRALLLGKKS
jgi:RNA polymerase sigma-70 factor (ECF subfamily)